MVPRSVGETVVVARSTKYEQHKVELTVVQMAQSRGQKQRSIFRGSMQRLAAFSLHHSHGIIQNTVSSVILDVFPLLIE